jgi:hypothetical protein
LVVEVKERDSDNFGIAIVVQPMGYSSWNCNDVTLSEVLDLLVPVSSEPTALSLFLLLLLLFLFLFLFLLVALLLLLLRILVCFWAAREYGP